MSQYNFDELYGAGTAAPSVQPAAPGSGGYDFDSLYKSMSQETLQSSLYIASNSEPDVNRKKVALTTAWKEISGEDLPWRNIEPNDLARKLRRRVNEETLAKSPTLAKLYEDPKFAELSFDETEQLSVLEQRARNRTLGDVGRDVGVTALKGAVGLPEAFVGLVGLPTGGRLGKALEDAGFRFNETQKILDSLYSPAQQAANRAVSSADGFLATIEAAIQNPSTIAKAVGESIPLMLGGAGIARGILASTSRLSPLLAAALGEGAISAGAAAEQLRNENPEDVLNLRQALSALGSGAGTALFGAAGGKVAQRLGIDDIDVVLTRGGVNKGIAETIKKGFARRLMEGGISEGLFEELPQSAQEQMWQNFANEKPLLEGVGNAAAMGLLSGLVMGGGFNALTGIQARQQDEADQAQQNMQYFTDMVNAAGAVQMRTADMAAFQTYMQQLDAGEAFLDPRELQAAGVDMNVLAQTLPSVAEQITEAVQNGTDIVVPRDELFTRLPGSGLEQSLLQVLRAEQDMPSAKQAQEQLAEAATFFQAETEKLVQQMQVDDLAKQSQQRVEETLMADLRAANRFTDDVNQVYAKLGSAMFTTLAARMSKAGQAVTAEDMFRQFALRVNAENVAGEQQLDQNIPDRPLLTEADMEGMLPEEKTIVGSENGVDYYAAGGGIYATINGREVGFAVPLAEDPALGFDVSVAVEQQRKGIGGRLFSLYRERNPNAPTGGLTKAGEGMVRKAGVQLNTLNQSASLRRGTETLKRFGLDPTKKHTTRQVAAALEARQREKYGSVARDDRSAETARKLAKWMVEEVLFEAQNPAASGVGWYSTKFQAALDTMGDAFPELKTDKGARDLMTALIAVTSDGQKVNENFLMAMEVYGAFKETGKFTSKRGHARDSSIKGNLEKIQKLHDELGADGMRKFLMREITIAEINAMARINGEKTTSDYTADTKMPVAATVFGPKLGAFYANLMGSSGYLTMDRWWSRTFNRYRGILVSAPTRQGLDRFKQLIGKPELSDDQAIAETVQYRKSYEAKNYKDGTETEKAANTIYKMAFENLEDTPFNASDRKFMVQTVKYAQQNLKRRGVEMSIADIQAVLWYYEKRLYGELGARQSADVSYEEAARRAVAARSGDGAAGGAVPADTTGGVARGVQPGEELFNSTGADAVLNQSAALAVEVAEPLRVIGNPQRASLKSDFTKSGIADVLKRNDWTILTGENPFATRLDRMANQRRNDDLKARLKELGLEFIEVTGKYGNEENSIIVLGVTKDQAVELGGQFGQESVLTNAGLVFTKDGSINPARGVDVLAKDAEDYYTLLPDGTKFSIKIDFDRRWPAQEGRVGEVSVAGVHFSKAERSLLDPRFYGRGAKGAEAERIKNAEDKRLGKRVHFYVNTGAGVRAEADVGNVAHVARLANLYDVDGDPLGIWKGDANTKESAVLDAGFSGYLSRNALGGTAVVFENVNVAPVGNEAAANAMVANIVPPSPQYSEGRRKAMEIASDPTLPGGAQTAAEWQADFRKRGYDVEIDTSKEGTFYKDEILRTLYQGEQARGQITFGNVAESPSTITLLKNADLSTFLHEMGHFYLEVLTSIAAQPNAPAEVVADMDAALKWFGVDSVQTWQTMSLEEKRAYHEQFARGFEAYLFEGKAPSVELKGFFSRIKAWMKNVYKQLTALNVTLTDEVRGVFDRMLATEQQINEAEAIRGMAPLFKTAEEMGAGPDEWAKYQSLHGDATETAAEQLDARSLRDMRWLNNARGRELRKLQKEAATKRKAVEAEVKAEVRQQPVYAVQHWLKYGELPDGTKSVGAKLDLDALKEMYGEGPAAAWRYLAVGQRGLAGKEGLHPDTVAEMFGFSSGDALVRALLDAQPETTVIEGMTDQRMLERYGDLSSPDAIERAADEAVHNTARAKFIATELAALQNAMAVRQDTGRTVTDSRGRTRRITENVLAKAAKDFAETLVERKRIKDIRPSQYSAAEARAAKAAERTSNFVEKVTEKRNQLVNHYAARIANDAVDYVEKQLRYLRRVSESKTIDQEYKDQIDQLLERYELRRVTEREERRRASLLEWIESQEEMGLDPVIDRNIVENAQLTNYRSMSLEDFRGLVDAVRNIEHLGRLKKKLLTAKDERELAEVVTELTQSIEQNANREAKVRIETGRGIARIGKMARGFAAMHRKFSMIAREMDGGKDGGAVWERLVRPMNDAGDTEITMRAEATKQLAAIFKNLDGIKLTRKEEVLPGVSMTREAQIMLALNWGNEGNRQRVIDGGLDGKRRLTPAEAEQIVFRLSNKEWDFVEAMWDFIGSYRPLIAEQEKRLTGVEPKWVEPAPFALPDGRQIKGGYFPAKYDGDLSTRSNELEAVTDLRQQMKGAAGRAATRNGYTKERSQEVKDRPLRKDFGVIMQHVGEVTHRIAWQDWLIDARRLLNAKPVDMMIREKYGPEILREMKEHLKDIAQGDVGAQSDLDRILGHIRSGVTIAGMGWNLSTGLMQPLGASQSIVRVGAEWFSKGLAHFAANPIRATEQAQARSKFMASRSLQLNRDLSDILNRIDKKEISAVEQSYFWFIYKFQTAVDVPTWWGAYEKAIAEGNDEARSVALADQAVIDAQGGGALKDRARIERGGAGQKLFTAFYSFFNTTYNLAVERGRTAAVRGPLAVPKLVSDYALLFVIPALAGALIKMALKGEDFDDEEKLAKTLAAEQLNYLLGTMILTREIGGGISAAVSGFSYTGPAALRLFGEVSKFAQQAGQGEVDAALLKAANNIGGIVLHYPAGQVQRTVEGMTALYEGETENPLVLFAGPPRQ